MIIPQVCVSPAPVAAVVPQGDMARYKTRPLCPFKVVMLLRDGAAHKQTELTA